MFDVKLDNVNTLCAHPSTISNDLPPEETDLCKRGQIFSFCFTSPTHYLHLNYTPLLDHTSLLNSTGFEATRFRAN